MLHSTILAKAPTPTAQIIVKDKLQLAGSLRSDVVYVIDGVIDMGSDSIIVPQGGLNIRGLGFGVSSLFTTAAGTTLFVDDGAWSGDLFIDRTDIEVSGAGSKVWDLDNDENFNAVECTTVNFLNCTELGPLANYRQGLWQNVALIGCVDGVEMIGTWFGGFASLTAIVVGGVSPTFTGTVFKAGAGLTINGSFRSDMNALGLADAGAFCDFAPSHVANNGGFFMNGVRVNPASNAFPNMPASDPKARFSTGTGTPNTYIGGQWSITAEATTVVAAANTPVKIAGTTTYADLQWFSQTVDNAFVYDGDQEIGTVMHGVISFSGSAGNQINIILRHWIDDTSSYVDLSETGPITMNAAGRAESVGLHAFCTFNKNDRFEVWVENQSAANNVTAKLGGIVSINERPS